MTKSEKSEKNGGFIGTGLATYARVGATIGGIIGIMIVVYLIFATIADFRDKHTMSIAGTVVSSQCSNSFDRMATCAVNATYTVDGKTYPVSGKVLSNHKYTAGEQINIQYDPQNVSDAVIEMNPRSEAYINMLVALLFIIIAGINIYYIFKSKSFASIVGGLSVLSIIVAILRHKKY